MRIRTRRRRGSRRRSTEAISDRLRLYPDPMATEFRRTAAELHGVEPDMVLAGNGSDDLLTILTRAFVGPGDLAGFPSPSYLLYSTLVALQDGRSVVVPYTRDWTLDKSALAVPGLKLFFLANPDSPSGTALTREQIAELAGSLDCPLVVDEAYADFADPRYHAMPLLEDHPNVIVTRSFSKGYSLAGIRLGYLVARAEIVAHLIKVKDSYNCDMLSQVAGVAGLRDQGYLAETRAKIVATRGRLTGALRSMGYTVPDSQSNFVWATGGPPARETFQRLKDHKILVRLMSYPGYPEGLRISVGTDAEIDRLLEMLGGSSERQSQFGYNRRRNPSRLVCLCSIRRVESACFPAHPGTLTLSASPRSAEIVRKTRETDIRLKLDLDGQGRAEVATGIGFLDHMLELFARHSLVDLAVACTGDLHVDGHHTTEDVGICLGQAIDRALGDRAGIRRYGHAVLPMDEALVTAAVDLGGRAFWVWEVAMPSPKIGEFDSELVADFWQAVCTQGRMNLHVILHHGRNTHHISEAVFKASARALRDALELDPRCAGVPSTKGTL